MGGEISFLFSNKKVVSLHLSKKRVPGISPGTLSIL
jgi:hypothetical protein